MMIIREKMNQIVKILNILHNKKLIINPEK